MKTQSPAASLPHDWTLRTWPRDVFPYDGSRARHLLRVNQERLLALGGLTRVGHTLVILGAGYQKWLASNARRVSAEYEVAANREPHKHKRFGRAGAGRGVDGGGDQPGEEGAP